MSPDAVAGRVVADRYELIETLGNGPMGPVWRANDRVRQRQVAVREVELPDILDDAEQAALAEKVLREASAAAALDHRVAVTVLDVIAEEGQPFVVSELVTARDLVDVVGAQGPLLPAQVAVIGLELLAALTAAHNLGLVHRDVRPSNVLLTETGVRLADFGVASIVDNPRIVGSGAMHEPFYLAPEQTESAGATALSDLWSLGATLYFAVEGVPPFDGGSPTATMAAIVNQPPRPAERVGALRPVLDALLVKDALDRPDDDTTRVLLEAAASGHRPAPAPAAGTPDEPVAVAPPTRASEPLATEAPVTPARAAAGAGDMARAAAGAGDMARAAAGAGDMARAAPGAGDMARAAPGAGDMAVPSAEGPPAYEWAAEATPAVPDAGGHPAPAGVGATAAHVEHDPMWAAPLSPMSSSLAGEPTSSGVAVDTEGPTETGREPWFFQVPAETVTPPPLPEPPPRPPVVVEPDRPPGRFPRGLWAALLALLIAGVMIALIITGGRTLRAQRPTIEKSASAPGAVSSWIPYTDSTTGFTIRYPSKWTVRRSGTQTFFVDPAGVSYLEVDHQQPPAPSLVDSAMDQEKSFSASHPTYERIGIDPTTYLSSPASLWQFSYTDRGTNIRAVDLGVNSAKYGFALYFQARAQDWTRAQGTFDAFKSVFGIPT